MAPPLRRSRTNLNSTDIIYDLWRSCATAVFEPSPSPSPSEQCNAAWCTSSGGCYAGTPFEGCTCSTGSARLTGQSFVANISEVNSIATLYEYTCCTSGSNVGEFCADYNWEGGPVPQCASAS